MTKNISNGWVSPCYNKLLRGRAPSHSTYWSFRHRDGANNSAQVMFLVKLAVTAVEGTTGVVHDVADQYYAR